VFRRAIIPFLNDKTWRRCSRRLRRPAAQRELHAAALPWEVKDLFKGWLEQHYPEGRAHRGRIRDMRGGRENDPVRQPDERQGSTPAAARSLRDRVPAPGAERDKRIAWRRASSPPPAAQGSLF